MSSCRSAQIRPTPRSKSSGRIAKSAAALLVVLILAGSGPAAAEEYDSTRSGHPLRVLAYIVHPIGVILDTLIFRPLHWLGSHTPVNLLVGQPEK